MVRRTTGDADLETDTGPEPDRDALLLDRDEFGVHLDGDDPGADGSDPDELPLDEVAETVTDVIDALAAAFNERDAEALVAQVTDDAETPGLLGGDPGGLPEGLESLWHRRPACCLTRGRVEDTVVGVLWDHDGTAWWQVATVHVDDVDDDGRVGVLEFSDDPSLLDDVVAAPPGEDLEEGGRWAEWDEGDGD